MAQQMRWYWRVSIAAAFVLVGACCAVGVWFWPSLDAPPFVATALPLIQVPISQLDSIIKDVDPSFYESIWPQDILDANLNQEGESTDLDDSSSLAQLSPSGLPPEFDVWSTFSELEISNGEPSLPATPLTDLEKMTKLSASNEIKNMEPGVAADVPVDSPLNSLTNAIQFDRFELDRRGDQLASTHLSANHDWAEPQQGSSVGTKPSPSGPIVTTRLTNSQTNQTENHKPQSTFSLPPAPLVENSSEFPVTSGGIDLNQLSQLPLTGIDSLNPSTPRLALELPSIVNSAGEASGIDRTSNREVPSQLSSFVKEPTESNLSSQAPSGLLSSATQYRLAAQPIVGDRFSNQSVRVDPRVHSVEADGFDFAPGPYWGETFDPDAANQIYEGKTLNATQRPLLELGRPWYQLGQLSPGQSFLGFHNIITPQLIVFGDFRTALASNQSGGNGESLFAMQANLFFDFKVTSTERFHFNLTPLTQGANNTRFEFDRHQWEGEWNGDINFGFFEGDLGAITGGAVGQTLPFDLPFAMGVMPLLFQNGVWLDDAILGAALTIPAKNSAALDISNFDVTFFAGFDKIDSAAFENNNDAAKLWGVANFIEALNGYIELDYAYLQDRDQIRDRSYHNIGLGYTRRYGRWLSNSTRMIVNAGQSTEGGENTADGVLLLSENSLISANPYTVLPYLNLFAGFDRPQSAARAAAAGGVLRNTGILFESDNLTGYPTLDATANQTYGAALGLSLLPADFSQQLVVETAFVGTMGEATGRNALDDQYGVGMRYQLPISNAVILRLDGMYGWLRETDDISGIRFEVRHKF